MSDLKPRPEQIDAIVESYRARLDDRHIYVRPDIPQKKLHNATRTYAPDVAEGDVLALVDGTLMGNAKDGALLTATGLYGHEAGIAPVSVELSRMRSLTTERKSGGTVIRADGGRVCTTGLADPDVVDTFARLVRDVAHPELVSAVPASRVEGRQVHLDLLHLLSAQWHRDALERRASAQFHRFPVTVTVPEQGRGSETHPCPDCGTPCVINTVSKAVRRRAEKVGAALFVPSAAFFAFVLLTEDSWYPSAATWLKVVIGVLFMAAVIAAGIGGWMVWWGTDLDAKKGVKVGQVAPQDDYAGGFAAHSVALRGKS